MLCPKKRPNTLLRLMVEHYGFVPVSPPQAQLPLASILSFNGSSFVDRSGPDVAFDSDVPPPAPSETAMRSHLDEFSDDLTVDAGFGLFGPWLASLGAGDVSAKVEAAARRANATSMRISIQQGRIRRVDPIALGAWLATVRLKPHAAEMLDGLRLYAVHSTWHAFEVRLGFRAKSNDTVSLDGKALEGLGAHAKFGVALEGTDKIHIAAGKTPVCFALDACGVSFDASGGRLDLKDRPPGVSRGPRDADNQLALLRPIRDQEWGQGAFLDIGAGQ